MARKAAWAEPTNKPVTKEQPQYWCSSIDFTRFLRSNHPELLVPESDIVYLGDSLAWDPAREAPAAPGLPCPADHHAIHPGSVLCCPHCHHSGYEGRLYEQRRLAGYPPPEPKEERQAPAEPPRPQPADPSKLTRRQRRWQQFALPGATLPIAKPVAAAS